jgi:PST family polysaccharide transporter
MAKDYSKLFDTKHLQGDLKKRSLKSGAVTLTSQGMMFVIQLASTMILARILTPDDYGMMAMVFAITGFAGLFINLGLSTATIQRAEINHSQVSTLFWINAAVGVFIMIIVAALSPAVAWFYKTPELKWVTLALSCNFFINGLAVQHQALLNRQMKFTVLAIIQVGGMLFGVVVAIIAAIYKFGYWALVFNSLSVSLFTVFFSWYFLGWMPGLPRKNVGVGEMIRFGADIVGFNVVTYFSRNLDNVLIGRFHGSNSLGIYSKAYQLLMMPITNLRNPLIKVALPALSKLQNDHYRYRVYYMKFISIISFVFMPLVVFMFVFSQNIINFFLGDQWIGSNFIFRVLVFVALIQPLSTTRSLVLMSIGRSRLNLKLGCIHSLFLISGFFVGIPWGANGVALSYVVSSYLLFAPLVYFSFKNTPIHFKDPFVAITKPLCASIIMGFSCHYLQYFFENLNDFYLLLVSGTLGLVIYVLSLAFVSGGFDELREYAEYAKLAFFNKK